MDELHKQTLEALGFWVRPSRLKFVALLRGEEKPQNVITTAKTEADAWALAPTLDALMPKLVEAIVREETEFYIGEVSKVDGDWIVRVDDIDDGIIAVAENSQSLARAVASVFVQMCEAGLIDGKAVVL